MSYASVWRDPARHGHQDLDQSLSRSKPFRPSASLKTFADRPDVEVREGDWREVLAEEEAFDLLFMDSGIRDCLEADHRDRTVEQVKVGGIIVLDDLKPLELWPPEWDDLVDRKREFALRNQRVAGTEVRTTATALIVTRLR